ncbi:MULTISPECIES: restriction endonuclease subunit S [Streptomyces]|uniref:restriction endonuclease subunit S n=1 Tax=Streptomyces TaxID=1883 RepID=UPI0004BDF21D|nr:restriction endonuclease subunit S [Streptomyces griseolus]
MSTSADVQWVPVRELGEVRMGKQLSPSSREAAGQFPYLRVANVHLGRIEYADVNEMGFTSAERVTYGLKPGDILLNEGQSLELVGRSAIYDRAEGEFCFQNTLIRFRPNGCILSAYAQVVFEHWLRSGVFAAIAKQTTSIAHLGGDRFAALKFPLLPTGVQQRIVAVLDSLAELERRIEASIVKLRSVRKGIISEQFSRADVEDGSPASRLRTLDSLADVGSGLTLGGISSGGTLLEVPYLRVANVQDGFISTLEMKSVRVTPSDMERFRVRRDDVLVTEGGDFDKVGRGAVWDGRIDPCLNQNHVFRVRCDKEVLDPHFLSLYMSSAAGRRYFLRVVKQTTNLASINSSQLKAMPVPCPPLEEQRRTVELVGSCDEQIAQEEGGLTKLRELKVGLVDDLLSRRVAVSVAGD